MSQDHQIGRQITYLEEPDILVMKLFGKVTQGMDVVNKIKATPTGSGGPFPTDVPKTPVTILKATLEK